MQHNLKQLGLTERRRNASGQFTQSRVAKGQPEAFTAMEESECCLTDGPQIKAGKRKFLNHISILTAF